MQKIAKKKNNRKIVSAPKSFGSLVVSGSRVSCPLSLLISPISHFALRMSYFTLRIACCPCPMSHVLISHFSSPISLWFFLVKIFSQDDLEMTPTSLQNGPSPAAFVLHCVVSE